MAAKLPKHLQDEIWMIMHMVTELGAHPEANKFSDKQFYFECEEDDDQEEFDGAINVNCPTERDDKEHELIGVAETLGSAADLYYREQAVKAEDTLVQDIADYIKIKGDGMKVSLLPIEEIFKTDVMGSLYSYFRFKLEGFLGLGEDFSKIALVSHVAKGVAGGLKDSSPDSIHLVTCLTTKFITDKYGDFLLQKGGLCKLVLDSSVE